MMNNLRKAGLPRVGPPGAELRRIGRQLGLLLSLAVVTFLYLMVLTRGGILR